MKLQTCSHGKLRRGRWCILGVALGRWSSAGGPWFGRERLYWRGWPFGFRWTPFVVMWSRYGPGVEL